MWNSQLHGKKKHLSKLAYKRKDRSKNISLSTTFRWLLIVICRRQPHVCRWKHLLTPKFGVTNRDQELKLNPTVLPKFPHKQIPKCLIDSSSFTSFSPQNTIITLFYLSNSPRMSYSKQVNNLINCGNLCNHNLHIKISNRTSYKSLFYIFNQNQFHHKIQKISTSLAAANLLNQPP